MRFKVLVVTLTAAAATLASAQVSSHAPVASHAPTVKAQAKQNPNSIVAMAAKPVARVNGAVLTEIDLQREMEMMFPYAQQHGGVPKSMEPQIRKGAMDMLIFEELLYQEAKRKNVQVAPARLAKAEAAFRKQFPDKKVYQDYLKIEFNGSTQVLREKIRRSLLIEKMLSTEVNQKSRVTAAQAKEYYNKNPKLFDRPETFSIQTISIIPPENASADVNAEAKRKIASILKLARQTKTKREFGILAEQVSEDDWRMKLGDRGTVLAPNLPPEIVKAARAMKPETVSDIVQLGRAYVVFRMNEHKPAGRIPFADVKAKLQSDLQKVRLEERRAELHKTLRKNATVEVL
ncbi:MAG TPA: peptidylprolyl isomerase [Terriglobales bacterium]|nr:peptidylprolyl isomerase [Terriglobales bacterium]